MRRPRVVYWSNIPTPYVAGRLNAVAARDNVKLEAWFNARRSPDRSWDLDETAWCFPARFLPRRWLPGRRLALPVPELRMVQPDLLVSLYASASFAAGSLAARALGIRTAYRVLPTYDTWIKRSWRKEQAKAFLFRSVDGAIVPGPDGAELARRYGIPRARIGVVSQSIDLDHYREALAVRPAVRSQRREELRLHGCVFLYVGRLWAGKGLDYLFAAYRRLHQTRPDVSLLIVGDGVDEAKYHALASDLPGVTFAGFVQPRELPGYYALADAFVFPTLGDPHGLVVEEAMAAGLPVISTEAAGDIRRRLPDGEAGYLVPPADAAQLAERMARLATSAGVRKRFGAAAQRLVADRGHEQWAIDFEAFVERIMSLPPRHTPQSQLARAAGRALVLGVRDRHAPSPRAGIGRERAA